MEVDGSIRALTANSFTSLSLNPPLVLFCLGKGTKAGQLIHQVTEFSVNILSQEQQSLSSYFAGAWKGRRLRRFRSRDRRAARASTDRSPPLAATWMLCTKAAITGSSSGRSSPSTAANCRARRWSSSGDAIRRSPANRASSEEAGLLIAWTEPGK